MNNDLKINCEKDIRAYLLENKDEKYKQFSAKLSPTLDKACVIGVRVPVLRLLAKNIKGTSAMECFINSLPHTYLEENHLHAFLIETVKDFDKALQLTQDFLPYIDNWATCDSFRPKVFKKHTDTLYEHIKVWIKSNHTYTVRYAIGMLLSFYLDEHFKKEHLELVSSIKSEQYYINMMIAWYFATALAKQYDCTIPYIREHKLSKWTHNKTISKACDSFRIDDKTKSYLRTLTIK